MENLSDSAGRWGIETSYFDVQGARHEASPEVLRRVIAELAKSQAEPAVYPDTGIAPQAAFQGDGRRVWILAVQLYGVRSARNWGHGDFTDLAALLEIVAGLGGAGVGLNPLHALFYDRSATGSPYSPSSRLFINPLYIDVTLAPGFKPRQIESFRAEIERLETLSDRAARAAQAVSASPISQRPPGLQPLAVAARAVAKTSSVRPMAKTARRVRPAGHVRLHHGHGQGGQGVGHGVSLHWQACPHPMIPARPPFRPLRPPATTTPPAPSSRSPAWSCAALRTAAC